MNLGLRGRSFGAALFVFCAHFAACVAAHAALADTLTVTGQDGAKLVDQNVQDGTTWCLRWNHSVTGGPVADCFADRDGKMMLERSYLHDFAAGLGEVLGRGHLTSASAPGQTGGGYWIEDMHERVANNTLVLRVGHRSVDHRLTVGQTEYALSQMAPSTRVTIRLIPTP